MISEIDSAFEKKYNSMSATPIYLMDKTDLLSLIALVFT